MRMRERAVILGVVGLMAALALPSAAFGQATRTWVSGIGDDANPCSRTAPCKTFAGAISKTATSGEINCLDPGGFGALTITKSIKIKCADERGGVLASLTTGIIVNATASSRVTLVGLNINGAGNGIRGIRVLQARKVRIVDSEIHGFRGNPGTGIDFAPSNPSARLLVQGSSVYDNAGRGIFVEPAVGGTAKAMIRDTDVDGNGSTGVGAFATNGSAVINLFNSVITDNAATGVFARGAAGVVRISNNDIIDNVAGIGFDTGGQIISFGNNRVTDNGNNSAAANGSPSSTVDPI